MEGKKTYNILSFANDEYYFNHMNTYKKQYRQILLDIQNEILQKIQNRWR